MTASRKPVVSWTVPQAPLTDANGHITWAWIKWFQGIQQTINSAFDQQGNFDGNLGVDVSIVSRPVTLLTILQNIDDTGVVTAAGIDFARPYLNKDTDHINDGLGNPLAGGRVAYAAMVGSGPHAGQILVFDGSTWQPHAKATTIPKAAHEWLDSYNDATGTFTASQPSFVDIIGTISPSQLPVATTSTVGVVKPDGTTITVDPDGTVHLANSGVSAGTYTNATVTVNAQGQVTAASSGSAGSSSYAPIQILQKTGTSGNGPSIAFPSANLVGSCIVVCAGGISSTPVVSDSQGNTYTTYAAAGSSAIFVALNVKGGSNTVTISGMSGNLSIYELSNVAQVEASTAGATGSSVSSLATGSASSVYPFELVLMAGFTNNNSTSLSNANSWTSTGVGGATFFGTSADYFTTVSAAGSISNTLNAGGSGNMYTGFVILRPLENIPNPLQPATAGKVLTANGAGVLPSFQDPAFKSLTTTGTSGAATLSAGVLNIPNYSGAGGSGALVFLEGHTASSSAELDFTSWLSVSYDVYEIHVVNLVLSATATLEWQASTNGGSSYDTGSNYRWTWTYSAPGGGGNISSSSATSINFRDINSAIEANGSINGRFTFYNPGGALFKLLTGQMSIDTATSTTSPVMIQGSGQYRVTTAVNAFRFLVNTGNITSGTIRIYGVSH